MDSSINWFNLVDVFALLRTARIFGNG